MDIFEQRCMEQLTNYSISGARSARVCISFTGSDPNFDRTNLGPDPDLYKHHGSGSGYCEVKEIGNSPHGTILCRNKTFMGWS
jgi:hypothetical protein